MMATLRTIEAQIVPKLKNNEARPNFTGSYKKKRGITQPRIQTHETFWPCHAVCCSLIGDSDTEQHCVQSVPQDELEVMNSKHEPTGYPLTYEL